MKLSLFKHTHHSKLSQRTQCQPGFASTLTVISVGVGLLLILISLYNDTVESQNTQKNHMLRSDYQQREEAFLRALTNIIPNKAIICMQNGSNGESSTLEWNTIFDEALILSNSNRQTISDSRAQTLLGLDPNTYRSGNSADTTIDRDSIINDSILYDIPGIGQLPSGQQVFPGSNIAARDEYPPPLTITPSDFSPTDDATYPLISLDKKYQNSAIGWVGADVMDYPLYNIVDSPSLHFNYQTGNSMIAKHNWWAFGLSMADNDAGVTRITSRSKEYLVSLYEIPSQLGINGASFTSLGAHADGSSWTNINVTGGVFAQQVEATGGFSSDAIASRKGVTLSGDATIGEEGLGDANDESVTATDFVDGDPFASNTREERQSEGTTFPITSAANGGRVSFLPINRGLEFYDRFANGNLETSNNPASINAVSNTSWNYYSIGARQCTMRLDIIDVESLNDQTPTSIRFTYSRNADGTNLDTMVFTKGVNWPDLGTEAGDLFPFHPEKSATDKITLTIFADRIQPYLTSLGASFPDINHSISVNPDYLNNPNIQQPSFPAVDSDIRLLFEGSRDLSSFTRGFSIVTNLRLIIADDTNVTPGVAPAGVPIEPGESYIPPMSLFAPETRYGNNTEAVAIEVSGRLTSLATGNANTPVRIGDLKSGLNEEVDSTAISAELESINHPGLLPPINTFNWMVVIREIHPTVGDE